MNKALEHIEKRIEDVLARADKVKDIGKSTESYDTQLSQLISTRELLIRSDFMELVGSCCDRRFGIKINRQ